MSDRLDAVLAMRAFKRKAVDVVLDLTRKSDDFDAPHLPITSEHFDGSSCSYSPRKSQTMTKPETAEPMQNVHIATDLNSCQLDDLLIAPDSDSADETDRILTALMQTQFQPIVAQEAEIRLFGGLDSLLCTACRNICSCQSEKVMGDYSTWACEPIRLLRQPFPCAPPKLFTRVID